MSLQYGFHRTLTLETILERENNDRMLWVEHERLKQRLEEIERKLEEKYNEKN